jgi:hypothetical protein
MTEQCVCTYTLFTWIFVSLIIYLSMLSVLTLYTVDDRVINGYGAAAGMIIGRGNQSTQRKPAPLPPCPPQTPHYLTLDSL